MFDLQSIDDRQRVIAQSTPNQHKSALGQYMTPSVVARFMAGMFNPLFGKNIRLLDAGAGIGSLCAAFAERASYECASSLKCEAWEIDPRLHVALAETLSACGESMATHGTRFSRVILPNDFILAAAGHFHRENTPAPTHAILNPRYKKVISASAHRYALRERGIETSNLYSAFGALALIALEDDGELVAITPRSCCNGPYFRPFRDMILSHATLR